MPASTLKIAIPKGNKYKHKSTHKLMEMKIKISNDKIIFHFAYEKVLVFISALLLIFAVIYFIFQKDFSGPDYIITATAILLSLGQLIRYFIFPQILTLKDKNIILKKNLFSKKVFDRKYSKLKIIMKKNGRFLILISEKIYLTFLNLELGWKGVDAAGLMNLLDYTKNKDNFYAFTEKQVDQIGDFLKIPIEKIPK